MPKGIRHSVVLLGTSNAKSAKSAAYGWLVGILYLAPSTIAGRGFNICPFADAGCRAACLYTAGRGKFTNVQEARIRKTRWLFDDRQGFVAQLCRDIEGLCRDADKQGLQPAVRLNGTSDLPWYSREFGNVPSRFPEIQFYDYTRSPRRVLSVCRPNYKLILSRGTHNDDACKRVLAAGFNVAAVFDEVPVGGKLWGHRIISGDSHDLRFTEMKGSEAVVVGLRAKGRAKQDHSGFVIKTQKCGVS